MRDVCRCFCGQKVIVRARYALDTRKKHKNQAQDSLENTQLIVLSLDYQKKMPSGAIARRRAFLLVEVVKMKEMPFWEQYALTIEEAASYFRIGEKKLRQIANDNIDADFLLWVGTRVLIKRELFEKYLDRQNAL